MFNISSTGASSKYKGMYNSYTLDLNAYRSVSF